MSVLFPPDASRLIVPVLVTGPRRSYEFRCTLDTGAERTVLPTESLRLLGCDLSRPISHAHLRSATGLTTVPLIRVPAVTALDRVRPNFLVAAHDFPLGVTTTGLLGLDFFRGFVLTIDFVRGRISLSRRRWWWFWN
jgi:hypothetical protein